MYYICIYKNIVITTNYIPVEVSDTIPSNSIVNIKITDVSNGKVLGKII